MNTNLITAIDAIVAGTASTGLLQPNMSKPSLGSTENSEKLASTTVDETSDKINNNDCDELNVQTFTNFPQILNEVKVKGLVQLKSEPNKSEPAQASAKDNVNLSTATVNEKSYKITDNSRVDMNEQNLITFSQIPNGAKAEFCIFSNDTANSSQEQSILGGETETQQQNLPEIVAHKQEPISLPPALLASLGNRTNQDIEINKKIFLTDENGQITSEYFQSVSSEELDQPEVLLTKQDELLFIEDEPLIDKQLVAKLNHDIVLEAKPLTNEENLQEAPPANQDIIAKDTQALSESLDSKSILPDSQVNTVEKKGSSIDSVLDSAVHLETPKSDALDRGQEASNSLSQLLITSKNKTSSEINPTSDSDKSDIADVISKRGESDFQQSSDDLSEKSFLRILNSAQLSISTEKVKDQNVFIRSSSNVSLESTPLSGDPQLKVSQASFNQPQPNIAPNNTLSQEGIKSVVEQVLESIHASIRSVDTQIIIRLNPPELGSVCVRFEQQQDEITGLLQVSNAETKCEIEQALPQIVRSLADSGIQIKQLDVQLEDLLQKQPDQEQLFQDSTYQHSFTREGGSNREVPIEWVFSQETQQNGFHLRREMDSSHVDMLA